MAADDSLILEKSQQTTTKATRSSAKKAAFLPVLGGLGNQMIDTSTVNSLVSDHSWCTTKWSLTGGGHLQENPRK